MALASPPPVTASKWKTSIIPVIVPNKPNKGAIPTHIFISPRFLSILISFSEISMSLMALEFQELLSCRESHSAIETPT